MPELRDEEPSIRDFSPITYYAMMVFGWARCISPSVRLNRRFPVRLSVLRPHNELTALELHSKDFMRRRGWATETYICSWVVLEILLALCVSFGSLNTVPRVIAGGLAALRIIEIVQVTLNAAFFDVIKGRVDDRIAARARVIVLSVVHYFELCVCFGIIYCIDPNRLHGLGAPIHAFYFSVVSQLTIGFGDINPLGWLRVVAAAQGLLNLFFVVLVLGRLVALLQVDSETQGEGRRDPPAS